MAYNHDSNLTADSLCLTGEQLTETTKIIAHAIAKNTKSSHVIEEVIAKIGVSEDSMKLALAHALMFLTSNEFRTIFGGIVAIADKPEDTAEEEHKCEECDSQDCTIRTAPYSVLAVNKAH